MFLGVGFLAVTFDLDARYGDYDPQLHSNCVSSLKEYGDYYQITVSKMLNDLDREPVTDMQRSFMAEGLTRSDARFLEWCFLKNRLELFGSDFEYPDVQKPDRVGRFINNVMRTRKTLDELGNCNEWKFFVTLTISPDKYDRHDFKAFYKVFSNFIRNCKQNFGFKMKYVFVPEQHKDGAWHLHGLVNDIPYEVLTEYCLKDFHPYTEVRCPVYIRQKIRNGEKLYYWQKYVDKFGWCIFEELRDSSKASNYITKYIGKGFIGNDEFKNTRLILPSLGLNRAVKIKRGFTSIDDVKPSFDCEYATTFKFPKDKYTLDAVLKYFR